MKLHLPKQLFTALLAIITLTAPATLTLNSTAWGAIYTATSLGQNQDMAYAKYTQTDTVINEETGEVTYTLTENTTGPNDWSNVSPIVSSGDNTFRFVADSDEITIPNKKLIYTFTNWNLGGLIVETGASGYSINASGADRSFNISGGSFTINEDFSIITSTATSSGAITLSGTQNWNIASGKTMTLDSGNYQTTISSGAQISINGEGSLKVTRAIVNNGALQGSGKLSIDLYNFANKGNITGYSINGETSDNGYATYSTVTLITGNGAIADSLKVSIGGKEYNASEKSFENIHDTEYFWVNSGTVTAGGNSSTSGTDSAKGFIVNNGTLSIAEGEAIIHGYTANGTSKIILEGTDTSAYFDYLFGAGTTTLDIDGAGRVSAGFALTSTHGQSLNLGDEFTGTLSIREGYMQLQSFFMSANAKLELISGQHWSGGNSTIAKDILLAGDSRDTAYVFRNSGTDTITGKVTGNYLNVGTTASDNGTLVLSNAANEIDYVTVGSTSKSMGLTIAENLKVGQIVSTNSNSSIVINEGKTLTITGDVADKTSTIAKLTLNSGSSIHLESEATLNKVASITGTLTLTGSGTYIVGNIGAIGANYNAGIAGLTNEETWAGTIAIRGGADDLHLTNLSGLSNINSKLKLIGITGWIGSATSSTESLHNHLILENVDGANGESAYALKLKNGYSADSPNVYFNGNIEGVGNIVYAWNAGSTATVTHVIGGNTSKWEGMFIRDIEGNSGGRNVAVKFTSGGNVFSSTGTGGVKDAESTGKLNLIIDSSSNNSALTTFNGSVSGVNTLTVNTATDFMQTVGVSTLDASDNTSFSKALTVSGSATVASGKTLALNGGEDNEHAITHSIGTLSAGSATVSLGANSSLSLGAASHSIDTLDGGSGSTLNLAAGSTLNSINTFRGSVTLSGEGSYHLGATDTLNSAISLHTTDWKGSLVYSNKARDKDLISKLNDLANKSANDTLVVSGAAGYIEGGTANKKLSADIKLKNPTGGSALTVVNGNSDKTAYITGKVSGTGDFVFKPSGYSNYNAWSWGGVTYEFTGSVKDWTGNIIYQSTSNEENDVLTITFSNDATEIYANVINNNVVDAEHGIATAAKGDKLAVKISNSKNVNVHGTINADEVTIANSANTSFHSTVNTSKVVLNSAATITKASDDKELAMTNAKLNSTSISSADTTGMTKGSISDADIAIAQLAQDASFTIQDMTLTNTTITAATAETRVNLNNVSASNLALATGKFTMNAAPVVGLGGTEATFNTGVSSLAAGAATLTLDLDMIGAYESTGAVSGATLTITLGVSGADFSSYTVENWQALVGFEGWLGTMLENQNATYQVADGAAAVSEGASAPTVSYGYTAGGGGGNVGTLVITISGLNVPEPASATLGLAALMMLCARRRRKA